MLVACVRARVCVCVFSCCLCLSLSLSLSQEAREKTVMSHQALFFALTPLPANYYYFF